MIEAGLEGVEFVVANTDAQQLQFSRTDARIQLGVGTTQGLGAGAHPEVGMNAAEPDLGRYVITKVETDKGAFKTPTIRNITQSAPYMHDGSVKTLAEVVELYAKGGEANQWLDPKIKKLELSEQDKKDLVAFMEACTGDFPPIERQRLPQ